MLKRTVSLSTYNLPMLWLDPHFYEKGSFYAHAPPATKGGIHWRGGGAGIIFGARHFLCAYHMKQVCGLGPHLHEYKCIYEHRCDKTCLQGF